MATTRKGAGRLALIAVVSCGLLVGATDQAGAARPSVLPPSARPHGASYAEWSARWWQWAFSTPATTTGPFGEGAVDCGVNQPHSNVWFLAGPFNASGSVERTCNVSVGTVLLIPVINVECSNLEDPPFFGATPAERAECVEADAFVFDDLEVTVDGEQIADLERYAVTSPDFAFTGVPFFLRTGKQMAEGARVISIAFREPPRSMFPAGSGVGALGPDHLTFDLADAARLSLSFYGKRPGTGMKLHKQSLQFSLHETGRQDDVLEAYERLIHDAMTGDHTLFNSSDGIERLWELSTPVLQSPPPVRSYSPGTWGPNAIHQLIAPNAWRLPFERPWRTAPAA